MNPLKRIKGTRDILPEESAIWMELENVVRRQMAVFNYNEIRTPVFEVTELFARGIGELTDIVSKEMYTFTDRSQKSVTLKPEMTAPVMRAYHENNLQAREPLSKLFYIAPLFRQERPQAGRLRQFHQFGAEFIGSYEAHADAETIILALNIFKKLQLNNLALKINTVGDALCREPYEKVLKKYLQSELKNTSPEVAERIELNPLRVLDSKDVDLQEIILNAPKLVNHLNEASQTHYNTLKAVLNDQHISYVEDATLVRGLDYYTHTVYEVTSGSLGAQNALCGGGRYNLLSRQIGGKDVPAVGFAAGIERILIALENQQINIARQSGLDVYIVSLGEKAFTASQKWLNLLRENEFKADTDFLKRSLKAQMREANRQQARFVLIMGEDELKKKVFSIKNMQSAEQQDISFDALIPFLKSSLPHP